MEKKMLKMKKVRNNGLVLRSNGTRVFEAKYDIEDLEIIISDANGNVLYYNKVDVPAGPYVFYVPSSILADMALVELYYGDTYLYGAL